MGQIKEINKEDFVEIGNHSHTHEYLADERSELIKEDIAKSISIFKKTLERIRFFLIHLVNTAMILKK